MSSRRISAKYGFLQLWTNRLTAVRYPIKVLRDFWLLRSMYSRAASAMVLRGTVEGTTDARTVGNTAILFGALQSSMFSRAAIAALRSFPILIGVRLPLLPGRR